MPAGRDSTHPFNVKLIFRATQVLWFALFVYIGVFVTSLKTHDQQADVDVSHGGLIKVLYNRLRAEPSA